MAETILKACLIDTILRPRDLPRATGISRTTIWRLETRGEFVPKIRLSRNAVGYRQSDVSNWLAEREELTLKKEECKMSS